ncbi:MAG TPA: LssY C-terminal domain-containing protein [Bryobacteraceae bacterium]|nr:LssY C-terminal domain-containing protein [Bryobacteraceae bacterium]
MRLATIPLVLLLAQAASAVTVPAGTEIQVRLTKEVSSAEPSGKDISAVVIAPVLVNNAVAISPGTQLTGKTADVRADKPAANGAAEQPAQLRIDLTQIQDKGASKPISCVVTGVDNARESVDSNTGLITGITASSTFAALADKGVDKLAEKYGTLGQLLSGVKGSVIKDANPAIDYKPGVDFTVKLSKPLDWNAPTQAGLPGQIASLDALKTLVNQEPFRTTAVKPPSPSDLTNLMFIGTKEQIQQAFKDAGWASADELDRTSTLKTAQAIIENNGYSEAPMSMLMLDGKPPDMTFEKQNNTFASRHHIRIWQMPQTFDGKPVFVAAATHDVKIYFSKTSKSITHGIDPNIDRERTKVTDDLVFTGRVLATALVDRANIPKDISNATGDKLQTDDKMSVLEFKDK